MIQDIVPHIKFAINTLRPELAVRDDLCSALDIAICDPHSYFATISGYAIKCIRDFVPNLRQKHDPEQLAADRIAYKRFVRKYRGISATPELNYLLYPVLDRAKCADLSMPNDYSYPSMKYINGKLIICKNESDDYPCYIGNGALLQTFERRRESDHVDYYYYVGTSRKIHITSEGFVNAHIMPHFLLPCGLLLISAKLRCNRTNTCQYYIADMIRQDDNMQIRAVELPDFDLEAADCLIDDFGELLTMSREDYWMLALSEVTTPFACMIIRDHE